MTGAQRNLWWSLALWLMALSVQAETLTMGVGDWCTYVCDSQTQAGREGYLVDVMRAVFAPKDVRIATLKVPFARNIQMNRQGLLDGIIGVYRNKMRQFPDDFAFSHGPLGWGVSHLYVAASSNWRYERIASLDQLSRIATVKAYSYGSPALEAYLAANPERTVTIAGNDPQQRMIRLLARGRIDAFVEDDKVVRYALHGSPLSDAIRSAGVLSAPMPVYIVFSPALEQARTARYQTLLREGIERLRRSGRLDAILNRYHLSDWKGRSQSKPASR